MHTPRGGIVRPTDIDGCVAWFDATDVGTITKDGSNNVSAWADKSSSGLVATTGSNFPVWSATAFNLKPGVTSSTLTGLDASDTNIGRNVDGLTLFAAAYTTSNATLQRYMGVSINSGGGQRGLISLGESAGGAPGAGKFTGGGRRLDSDTYVGRGGGTVSNNVPFIHVARFDYANATLNLWANSVSLASSSFQTEGFTSDTTSRVDVVGRTGGSGALIGVMGEAIIYHRALTQAERRAVEWYLSKKWGINVV